MSTPLLSSVNSQGILTPKPVAILQTKSRKLRNRTITQHLIYLGGFVSSSAAIPSFCGQDVLKGGGVVRILTVLCLVVCLAVPIVVMYLAM